MLSDAAQATLDHLLPFPPPPSSPDYRFDVSKLEPVVAAPHSPDNRKLARECRDVKIDRVYIGSWCGGGCGYYQYWCMLLACGACS